MQVAGRGGGGGVEGRKFVAESVKSRRPMHGMTLLACQTSGGTIMRREQN